MSALSRLIQDYRDNLDKTDENDNALDFRNLFKDVLRQAPYFLRYALDDRRPDLFMIYMTDYSDKDNEIVRECNGIILDRHDFSIVAYGMNKMQDRTVAYHDGKMSPKFDDFDIEEAEDGTVLTVFNHRNEWIVSTKRNIDASMVKWSSPRNFLQLLCDAVPDGDALGTFARDLDPEYTYSFILLHPENHLVVQHQKPRIVYISKRNRKTLQESNVSSAENRVQIGEDGKRETGQRTFEWAVERNSMDPRRCLENLNKEERVDGRIEESKRGIILSKKVGHNVERTMIDYKWFYEANQLRKGQPSMHLSYLACNPEEKQKMRKYFGPLPMFNEIDVLLRNLAQYTFAVYRDSYVRKQFKVSPEHPICKTLRRLHYDYYKTTKEPIRMHDVLDVLRNTHPRVLDYMLRYFSTYGFQIPTVVQQQSQMQHPQQHQHQRRLSENDMREQRSSVDKPSSSFPANAHDRITILSRNGVTNPTVAESAQPDEVDKCTEALTSLSVSEKMS